MTPEAVQAKYGVPPERYSDLAALVGESSDNLPGVPGVGPKTAAKWINQYGDLTGVVAHVDQIKGKAGETLREHLDGVLRNRRLNQLVSDVPLEVAVPELARQVWDRDEVHQVFDGLEFRVLRDRLFDTLESVEQEAEAGFEVDGSVLTAAEVPAWLDAHAAPGTRVGVSVVGAWARGTGDVEAVAVATADGPAAYIDLADLDQPAEEQPARLAGRRGRAEGAARRQGAAPGAAGPGAAAGRHHQRHRAGGLPRPARPALLRPRRPRACATCSASCGPRPSPVGQRRARLQRRR